MSRNKQTSRFLASLLAMAVFFSQTSTVFAAFDMYPVDNNNAMSHCMMMDMDSGKSPAKHDQAKHDQAKQAKDCCKTSDCASNFCITGLGSSSVLMSSLILLQSSLYTQTVIDISDQRQTGLDASSLYRPPRHNA